MLQHNVCENTRPRPFQGVAVGVLAELGVHVGSNVVTHFPQSWVPRRSCKDPLQHLPGPGIVPVGCNFRGGKLVLPAHQQSVLWLDDAVHSLSAFCVNVCIHPTHAQDHQVSEEVCALHVLWQIPVHRIQQRQAQGKGVCCQDKSWSVNSVCL